MAFIALILIKIWSWNEAFGGNSRWGDWSTKRNAVKVFTTQVAALRFRLTAS
jgi:hypothetical protein